MPHLTSAARPRHGLYFDRSFRRPRRWRAQAVPRLIPSDAPPAERERWPLADMVLALVLLCGMAASLLLAVAVTLGAAWLVLRLALELARLIGG